MATGSILKERLLEQTGSPWGKQIALEKSAVERGYLNRKRTAMETISRHKGSVLAPVQSVTRLWHREVVEELRSLRRTRPVTPDDHAAVAVLRAVPIKYAAQSVLSNIVSAIMRHRGGVSLNVVAGRIGKDLESHLKGRVIGKALRELAKGNPCGCSRCAPEDTSPRTTTACEKVKRLKGVYRLFGSRETGRVLRIAREKPWLIPDALAAIEQKIYFKIGVMLVERVTYHRLLTVSEPQRDGAPVKHQAFRLEAGTITTRRGNRKSAKRPRQIVPSRVFVETMHGALDRWCIRKPVYPFSVVPPPRWADPEAGGYTLIRKGLISNGKREQYAALQGADLSRLYEGLDAMGEVPWQVVPQVADVIEAFVEGKVPGARHGRFNKAGRWVSAVANIAPTDDPPVPPHPIAGDQLDAIRAFKRSPRGREWRMTRDGRAHAYWVGSIFDQHDDLRGERITLGLQMESLRSAREQSAIYFPHNIDFRGRAKPITVHGSYQSHDVVRGALRFAQPGRKCADMDALLSINAATRWGGPEKWDKATMEKRATFAAEYRGMIDDVARDPLGCMEWLKADDPFQFLSACLAIRDMHDNGEMDHALRLPIYRDATANGLQHFAAAMRDAVGAALVNLVDGHWRVPTYTVIAGAAVDELDGAATSPEEHALARLLAPILDDSIVKTPVMTTPYGVTLMGMKQQMFEALKSKGLTDEQCAQASLFLAKVIHRAMHRVAGGAMRALEWLRACAKVICAPSERHPSGRALRWTTELGLPVVQAYRKETKVRVEVNGHSYTIDGVESSSLPVNLKRQVNGAAPNMVHSWDAVVASRTVVGVRRMENPASVAAIFDCFGTTVDRVGDVTRRYLEEFVRFHEVDRIGLQHAEWTALYPDVELPPPPPKGDFDIRLALNSTYALS